jgi:hypothetical protein
MCARRPLLLGAVLGSFAFGALLPAAARADDGSVGLAVSLERVAGVAYASIRPTSSDTSFGATSVTFAGAAINPIALPRIGADAILPMGLTLGGAIAYGAASLSSNPDRGQSSSETGHAFLISPRVGYLIRLSPLFDLVPRLGVTIANAGLTSPDQQVCTFSMTGGQSCTTAPGDSVSLTLVAASVDVAAAVRLTRTFNLLAGLAYDHVFSASGSSTNGSNGQSTDAQAQGKYFGFQLWLGLGGYVL